MNLIEMVILRSVQVRLIQTLLFSKQHLPLGQHRSIGHCRIMILQSILCKLFDKLTCSIALIKLGVPIE